MISGADRQLLDWTRTARAGLGFWSVGRQASINGRNQGSPDPRQGGLTLVEGSQALGETLIACSAVALLLTIKPGKAIV